LKKQIRFFEEKLRDLEEQSRNENPQLLEVIRQKESELEMWKQKYHNIEQDTQAYIDKTLGEVEVQFKERIEKELSASKNHIKDLEVRQILFCIEIERLYVINGEFIEEINRITHEINNLISENEQLQTGATNTQNYERIIAELKRQVDDYDNRNKMLITENSRLSEASHSRLREIESLKRAPSTGNMQIGSVQNLRKSQADFDELNLKFESNKGRLEAQILQFKHIIEQNNKEIQKLEHINHQRKEENDDLHHQLEQTKQAMMNFQNPQSESHYQQDHFNQLLKEIDEMKKARNFYRQQYEQVSLKLKEVYNEKINSSLPKTMPTLTNTTEPSNHNSRNSSK